MSRNFIFGIEKFLFSCYSCAQETPSSTIIWHIFFSHEGVLGRKRALFAGSEKIRTSVKTHFDNRLNCLFPLYCRSCDAGCGGHKIFVQCIWLWTHLSPPNRELKDDSNLKKTPLIDLFRQRVKSGVPVIASASIP